MAWGRCAQVAITFTLFADPLALLAPPATLRKSTDSLTVLYLVDRSLRFRWGRFNDPLTDRSRRGTITNFIAQSVQAAAARTRPVRRDAFGRRPHLTLPPSDVNRSCCSPNSSKASIRITPTSAGDQTRARLVPRGMPASDVLLSDSNENLGSIGAERGSCSTALRSTSSHPRRAAIKRSADPIRRGPADTDQNPVAHRVLIRSYNPKSCGRVDIVQKPRSVARRRNDSYEHPGRHRRRAERRKGRHPSDRALLPA